MERQPSGYVYFSSTCRHSSTRATLLITGGTPAVFADASQSTDHCGGSIAARAVASTASSARHLLRRMPQLRHQPGPADRWPRLPPPAGTAPAASIAQVVQHGPEWMAAVRSRVPPDCFAARMDTRMLPRRYDKTTHPRSIALLSVRKRVLGPSTQGTLTARASLAYWTRPGGSRSVAPGPGVK
jgi:hypothetical protein